MAPMIRKMARLPRFNPQKLKAKMSRRVVSTLGRQQFLTVRIEGDMAVPVFKKSGAITSLSAADGYVEIAANVDLVEKDEVVELVLFRR
jgi:molybdopterin molybdotransferase